MYRAEWKVLSFCLFVFCLFFSPGNVIGSARERTMKEEVKYLLTKKRKECFIGIGGSVGRRVCYTLLDKKKRIQFVKN
jgi:hypothetical protein